MDTEICHIVLLYRTKYIIGSPFILNKMLCLAYHVVHVHIELQGCLRYSELHTAALTYDLNFSQIK
jgi:hypothetical protein